MSDTGHAGAESSGADFGGVQSGTGAGVDSGSSGSAPPAPSYSPSGDFAQVRQSEPASGGLRDEDDESVDFFSGFETSPAEEGDPTSPLTPPVPGSDPTQIVPPGAQPAPAAVAPPVPQPGQPAAQPEAQPQAPPQGEALPESLEGFMTLASQNPQWVMDNLAKSPEFLPSDEDMEALMSGDAPTVKQTFAQFGARMHYRSVMAAMNLINNWVPKLINEGVQNQQKEAEIRGQFKTQFPHLDLGNPQVMNLISQAASQVKALPGLTPQQRLQRVGTTVSALLGMPTAVGAPSVPQRQPSFVPASGGNAVPSTPGNGEVDMWGGLARDYDG